MSTATAARGEVVSSDAGAGRGHYRWFPVALALLLAGYLFLGRPFAYLHVPGTPVFIGEVVLAIGLYETLRVRPVLWTLLRSSRPAQVLAAFAVVGAGLFAGDVAMHGILAARDSALWYYTAFAFMTAAALLVRPDLLSTWARQYRRLIPYFLAWVPVAVVLGRLRPIGLTIPDSTVNVLSVKAGDLGVSTATAMAFLWLLADVRSPDDRRQRTLLTVIGALALLAVGTQNRGGFVAGGAALLVLVAVTPARSRLVLVGTATVVAVAALALLIDFRIALGNRELSVDQLMDNLISVIDPTGAHAGNLESTVAWRQQLWNATVDDVTSKSPVTGFGFGPNLAARYGFGVQEGLRNPHNSHLSVLARMGLAGTALWVLLWLAWSHRLARMVRRRTYHGRVTSSRTAAWCLVAATAFLVNAAFDPTLEGPQAAIWLWTIVGVGLAISSPVRPPMLTTTADPRRPQRSVGGRRSTRSTNAGLLRT